MSIQHGTKEVDKTILMNHVAALCAKGERVAGSEEEGIACSYILSQLKSWGISCTLHRFRALISNPLSASLDVPGDTGRPAQHFSGVGTAFSVSTPPEGLCADIVFVSKGTEKDYQHHDTQGKIILLDGLVSAAQGRRAKQYGAVGIIGIAQGSVVHKNTISTVWGRPNFTSMPDLPRIPVLCLNREDGDSLISLVLQGGVHGVMHTKTEEEIRVLRLPVADIPGKKPEFVLVGAHYCSWFDGATDNATGNAVLLELARILHAAPKMQFGVRLAWWPGHSQGRFSGSAWYAETFRNTLQKHCIGYLNIDSPGSKGAIFCLPRYTMGEAMPFVERCLQEVAPNRTVSDPSTLKALTGKRPDPYIPSTRPARQADQSFWEIGLTSFSMYSSLPPDSPDFRSSVGGSGGAWWWHSKADTLDKVDSTILAGDTRVYLHMLRRLAGSKVLPWDYTQTIQDFIQSLHGYEEATAKSTEYLPEESCSSLRLLFKDSLLVVKDYDDSPDFAPVYQSLSTLKQSALALREQMNDIERKLQESQSTPTIEKQVDMLNAQCLAFGRALIPLLYLPLSCPSNKVPAIGLPLLPDLACIMQLNKFPVCSSERISIYWEISRILSTINMKLEKIKYIIKENNH